MEKQRQNIYASNMTVITGENAIVYNYMKFITSNFLEPFLALQGLWARGRTHRPLRRRTCAWFSLAISWLALFWWIGTISPSWIFRSCIPVIPLFYPGSYLIKECKTANEIWGTPSGCSEPLGVNHPRVERSRGCQTGWWGRQYLSYYLF